MSTIGKYQKKGFYIDPDTFKYRTKHKSGIKDGSSSSDCNILVDKKSHLFHNDSVFIFDDESDHELYYGINKRAWDFDGDFDDFCYGSLEYDIFDD